VSGPRVPRRGYWLLPLLLLGMAIVLVVAFAAQLVFANGLPWPRALEVSADWWLVPLGVLVIGAVLTFLAPLERGRWAWTLPLHVVVCAVVITAAAQFERERIESRRNAPPPAMADERPPLEEVPGAPPDGRRGRGPGGRDRDGGPRRSFGRILASSRWQLFLAVYAVSVSLGSAWRLRQQALERERRALELSASLSLAKLEALRLQLQPHFLFNTLNAIATLVHRDANAADEMITNLGDLLRLVLESTDPEVPLRRELDLVDRYLAIERVRLGERLQVERTVAPGVLDAAVPPLMLQTLVENAVRHGVEPRRETGAIAIRAERVGGQLSLIVSDNGVGLPGAGAGTEKRGIGLANTEARLRELYGGRARLTLLAPPEGGTRVEIAVPWRVVGSESARTLP
jgi:hypothetical protein